MISLNHRLLCLEQRFKLNMKAEIHKFPPSTVARDRRKERKMAEHPAVVSWATFEWTHIILHSLQNRFDGEQL